ncbi:MAG: hypothetical protein JXA92_07470 [candidate division Zixibacteria bacterium]|nr:hypothetical protein [candidate division Zixibacteria bacterium]
MIYELWVAKTENVDTSISASDVVSMGRFSYHDATKTYFDSSGQEMANRFVLKDDIFKYSKIFVSVEDIVDVNNRPGPIMLIDDITNPQDNPIYLVFPESDTLHNATVTFNKETVSDRNRTNDGRGIWFCNYETGRDSIPDTVSLIINFTPIESDTPIYDAQCSVISTTVDTIPIVYGPDTIAYGTNLRHIRIEVEYGYCTDTIPPYQDYRQMISPVAVDNIILLDIFNQFDFNLPDYTPYGWKYKGWVVSKAVPTSAIGELTPPVWPYHTLNYNHIPGYTGGLITTGTFSRVDTVDDGNPYTLAGQKVPPFPGEDFLDATALFDSLGLSSPPNLNSDSGTAFISLEPANFTTDTTNFPLFVMLKPIDPGLSNQDMFNRTATIKGDLYWFPQITVNILERY